MKSSVIATTPRSQRATPYEFRLTKCRGGGNGLAKPLAVEVNDGDDIFGGGDERDVPTESWL
jgi:hypothetical protein